jgi:hypothetical protein
MKYRSLGFVVGVVAVASCATLGQVIQPPRLSVASGRQAQLRLIGPSVQSPLGGAAIRIWARVENPNPVGFTLAGFTGDLFLEDTRAAAVDFPFGVPLVARQDTVIPLDISLRFSDLPGLAQMATRLLTRSTIAYRRDGTRRIDAGALGQPSFGPTTWLRGELPIYR